MAASGTGNNGSFVRVMGHRTVGRNKSFRKKFPLNQDQVVTRMVTAYWYAGVLLLVVPTKLAANMAVAAILVTELLQHPEKYQTKKWEESKTTI